MTVISGSSLRLIQKPGRISGIVSAQIQKHFPNIFRGTGLELVLREHGAEKIIVAGMMSHMCIDATIRAAADLGFSCILVHDACATRDLSFNDTLVPASMIHTAFISALSGLYARTCTTDEVITGQYI